MVASMMGAFFGLIVPQERVLKDVGDALCSGNREFVYAIDGMGTPVWGYPGHGSPTEAVEKAWPSWKEPQLDFTEFVINAVIGNSSRSEPNPGAADHVLITC